MNWKKHLLSTYFAGCRLDKDYNEEVLECFPNIIVSCPISEIDTFQDGVYYLKSKGAYVKLDGIWYWTPKLKQMFEYYQFALRAEELRDDEKKAIRLISRTRFSTQLQRQLAKGLESNDSLKRLKLDMKLTFLRYKKEKGLL